MEKIFMDDLFGSQKMMVIHTNGNFSALRNDESFWKVK
jgi:hypothetical protein